MSPYQESVFTDQDYLTEEDVMVVLKDFRQVSFWENIYSPWICVITDKKRILFIQAAPPSKLGISTPAQQIASHNLENIIRQEGVKRALALPNKKALIEVKSDISFKPGFFFSDKVIFKIGAGEIILKTYRWQFNILRNILEKKMSYLEAMRNSGPNYAKILLKTLAVIIAFVGIIIFWLSRG